MTSIYFSVLATVAACTTALVVGYLHRKQIRQVEAFRQNPAVGLHPPDSVVTRFVKDNWFFLFLAWPVYSLAYHLRAPGPPTRADVFVIAFNVGCLAVVVAVVFSNRLLVRALTSFTTALTSRFESLTHVAPSPDPRSTSGTHHSTPSEPE